MIKHLLILLMFTVSVTGIAQDVKTSVVVLELFTSQGCSSCPPADELLNDIKEKHINDQVFVLSYHVDYWNRLGWKDPFSTEEFSDYQRAYAQQFKSRSMYTPQLVVNGSEHFTGSDGTKAQNALKKYSSQKITNEIVFTKFKRESAGIALEYEVKGNEFKNLTLALVVSERTTKIGRGENRNRALKNTNIVATRLVETRNIGNSLLQIPDWVDSKDELFIIGYTHDKTMKITGAIKVGV